ncbi:DUF7331 family protein [Natronomonas amylolytica]|uniref:DUF7331 family protein n=1 Tax=Natronomonas amylolytica TaxID=3108498 RepID=UPI003AB34FCD
MKPMSTTQDKATPTTPVECFASKDYEGLVLYNPDNPEAWVITDESIQLINWK